MNILKFLFFALLLLISTFVGYSWATDVFIQNSDLQSSNIPVAHQEGEEAYDQKVLFFPRTGYWVSGPFFAKYDSVENPEQIYGLPISDVMEDEHLERWVQYFEKARFEYYPDRPVGSQIELSPLGYYLYEPAEPLALPTLSGCKRFEPDGFPVCYDFLEFYESHGGVSQFGYPISGFEIHDGVITQYFEYARLEWRPDLSEEGGVIVSNLGMIYFHMQEESTRLHGELQDNIPAHIVTSISAAIFVDKPTALDQESIQVYILVKDQFFAPVQDALIVYQVIFPDGNSVIVYPGVTDERGINISDVTVYSQSEGLAEIRVAVGYDLLTTETETAFWIFH